MALQTQVLQQPLYCTRPAFEQAAPRPLETETIISKNNYEHPIKSRFEWPRGVWIRGRYVMEVRCVFEVSLSPHTATPMNDARTLKAPAKQWVSLGLEMDRLVPIAPHCDKKWRDLFYCAIIAPKRNYIGHLNHGIGD